MLDARKKNLSMDHQIIFLEFFLCDEYYWRKVFFAIASNIKDAEKK